MTVKIKSHVRNLLADRAALTLLAGAPQGITADMIERLGHDLAPFRRLVKRGLANGYEQRHSNPPGLIVIRYCITQTGRDLQQSFPIV